MARIAGVDLPRNKRIEIALTAIYGMGRFTAQQVCDRAQVDPAKRSDNLSDAEVARLREIIDNQYKVEGELRRDVSGNIKRLIDVGCYRGFRHRRGLPVRGQRTHTNARTRKGPRKAAIKKKKIGGKK